MVAVGASCSYPECKSIERIIVLPETEKSRRVFYGWFVVIASFALTLVLGATNWSFAPYIAGFIFDTTGGYFWAFIIVMSLLSSASLVAAVIKKPSIALK